MLSVPERRPLDPVSGCARETGKAGRRRTHTAYSLSDKHTHPVNNRFLWNKHNTAETPPSSVGYSTFDTVHTYTRFIPPHPRVFGADLQNGKRTIYRARGGGGTPLPAEVRIGTRKKKQQQRKKSVNNRTPKKRNDDVISLLLTGSRVCPLVLYAVRPAHAIHR